MKTFLSLYNKTQRSFLEKNCTFTESSISSSDHPDSAVKAVAVTWGLFTR